MSIKKNDKGFTFIELILYMAILSIFMVAVVGLMGSAIKSYRTVNARKTLQTSATETYDSISDMLMSAVDVKIYGTAYHTVTNAGVTSYDIATEALFVVPEDTWTTKDGDSTNKLYYDSGMPVSLMVNKMPGSGMAAIVPGAVFDISTIKSFADSATVTSPSTDETVMIDIKAIYIRYASGLDSSGNTIYTDCTISYDDAADKLYMYREDNPADVGKFHYMDSNCTDASQYVFCKNVSNFRLQTSPETGTFGIILELEDNVTSTSYDAKGVVSLRNSFVLKKHEWD